MNISLKLNGKDVSTEARPDKRLSAVLREKLNQKGIRKGCGNGRCGNCIIIMDDELVASCLIPAFAARHKEITTIEGISQSKEFNYIHKGFKTAGVQLCSYCAPSRVISTAYLLSKNINPTEEQILDNLSAVQCRCSSYNLLKNGIIQASLLYRKNIKNG